MALAGFSLLINSSWTASPDAALYLALGESLARGDGYVFDGQPHTFVPPGYPLILAAFARLFGGNFLVYRILMALLGLFTAAAGYWLVRRLCGRDTALLAGGAFALNHVLLENSALTLADVPFALFTLLALHAALSASGGANRCGRLILAGLLAGLPPLIRINGLGIPPALAFFLWCSWKNEPPIRRFGWLAAFLVLSLAPVSLWEAWKASFPVPFSEGGYLYMIGGRELGYQAVLILKALWGYVPETSYALTGAVLRTGFLELIAPLLALWGFVAAARNGEKLLVPLTVIQYGGLLLSPAGSRYLIFLIPGLYLFFALGLLRALQFVSGKLKKTGNPPAILMGCFALLVLLNVGHNAKTVYQARTALESYGSESERSLPFFEAARRLKVNAPEATVLATHPRIIHYLSGCRTVPLVRSGVPDHQAFVVDRGLIEELIGKTNPQFLFADTKDAAQYAALLEAFKAKGRDLREIPLPGSSQRYRLFRVDRGGEPG